jgi:hypothetical protein
VNSLPPPRLSGLAWRDLSKGVYADDPDPLVRIEANLAADYDLTDAGIRPAVWLSALGSGGHRSLHEIVLRYEAEASRRTSGDRRAGTRGAGHVRGLRGTGAG